MQIKITLPSICVIVFGINLGIAEPVVTTWGNSVQGIRLSLTMTNTVADTGSSIGIVAAIRNSSTNAISLGFTGTPTDFDLVLAGGGGKLYHLIPPNDIDLATTVMIISPEQQRAWTISVTLEKNIKPGGYTLNAIRNFVVKHEHFKLVSNSLKVQIK